MKRVLIRNNFIQLVQMKLIDYQKIHHVCNTFNHLNEKYFSLDFSLQNTAQIPVFGTLQTTLMQKMYFISEVFDKFSLKSVFKIECQTLRLNRKV